MRRRAVSCLLAVAAAIPPTMARADESPARDVLSANPDKGWYVSGKGGPAFAALRDVQASQSGRTVQEGSASNLVGAFGMAAGYEWMYRYHVPLRTELEFMNRTEVTYDASPLLLNSPSGALASTAQNVTTMARGYWHFPVDSDTWWPFVSAGVGWSHNTVKGQYTPSGGTMSKIKTTSDDLAWSAGVGASFKLGPQMMNDIELRYVDLGATDWGLPAARDIGTSGLGGFSSVELIFSLRYVF
jgi:opacity protein-like surface antigen